MDKLGRFEQLEEIGRGGCGIVYKAIDPRIGRTVAIKTMIPGAIHDEPARISSSAPITPEAPTNTLRTGESPLQARLRFEAQSAGRLTHPNIVTIYELDEDNGLIFVVMEFVAGKTLSATMAGMPLPLDTALQLLKQMADALDHAHSNGIVHRDIKPANILINERGHVKVTDFGIAKLLGGTGGLTQTGAAIGTAYYMAPEQIEGKPVSAATDQFSLAVMAFEMLAGRRPFQGDSWASVLHQILNVPPPSLSDFRNDVPLPVSQVLKRALAKDSASRYPSCRDFVQALERAEFDVATEQATRMLAQSNVGAPAQPPVPARKAGWLLPVTIGAALAAVGGGYVAFRTLSHPAQPAAVAETAPPVTPPAAAPQPEVTPEVTKAAAKEEAVAPPPVPAAKSAPAPAATRRDPAPVAVVSTPSAPPIETPVAVTSSPSALPPPPSVNPVPKQTQPVVPPDERAWADLANSRSAADLERFARDYPNSSHTRQALQRAETLEWDRVRAGTDARALNEFIAKFPNGDNTATARQMLATLDARGRSQQLRQQAEAALERYRNAFEHRSMEELKRAWPGLTRQEESTFQQFFKNARSVSMNLRIASEPESSGDGAVLRVVRGIQMVSERGREPLQESTVVVRLKRAGQELVIDSIALSK